MNACSRIFADEAQINNCKELLQVKQPVFTDLAQLLSLTGNEVRLKILFLLQQEDELCPCDLSDILGMTIPAISQHLRKLKDGGMIKFRKSGQTIFYSLCDTILLLPLFNLLQTPLTTESL
ncbi:metalloregulator ArsR/SmtB family transcription factor [Mucilaginibacter sp. L3T2-6]|uniref:ArsR/SmtB family transcription factor n=1 Tax=Mucilaginibacter sp. L3T2-6 TaxID=3062491 RepID=UPI0026761B5C|nr:metalloregulator ArsR/SmtB family transcription factor [Mucilaginibacter sp. L3T2-6]MDO3641485.1 metalloregulator ArsR/SmtB family transcription factor [Mucilaginibacter sp. L3T2-6]MDV6213754.1 metalloregulator ArsR/SmtB family transcription factor [Mucilaginibacter sp. L3T2-6]